MVYSCIIYIRPSGHTAALNTAHYSTFLFFEVRSWNLVWRIFLRNETIWYIYVSCIYGPRADKWPSVTHCKFLAYLFLELCSWNLYTEYLYPMKSYDIYMYYKYGPWAAHRPSKPAFFRFLIFWAMFRKFGRENIHMKWNSMI